MRQPAENRSLDTVPNLKRKETALHGRFDTQILALPAHG